MANSLRGEAAFKAGASDYVLVFDVNTFCALEDETGLGVSELIDQVQARPSFKLLRSIFCAGLQNHHPRTTIAEAGEIMSDAGLETMQDALSRALKAAMPAPEASGTKSTEGKGPKVKAGTGSAS
ncbi:hypothetical protein [Sphingobium cupriresistens]|uniref:Gene transfer agent family protein n=1 Tax=Sphingobium cupriresistens TaxID=1132417 RepID=A0A8G1ZDD2_9SPHN|nr:hypothetical protein [Sphingobium cupriresistens]RYM07997.1 hypothetical protein EWH12_17840 [Sphingobium cupriresistens]